MQGATTISTGTADEAEAHHHHEEEEEAHERLLRRLEGCLRESLEWVEQADGSSSTAAAASSSPLVRPLVLTGQRWPAHHVPSPPPPYRNAALLLYGEGGLTHACAVVVPWRLVAASSCGRWRTCSGAWIRRDVRSWR